MHILYLSQYFPPEMGAPAARVSELSRAWVRVGHKVTVLTGFPHHPTGIVPEEYRGEWVRRESFEGVDVIRAPIYASANEGRFLRSLSYVSYAASASTLGPLLARRNGRPDVVLATSPQLLTGLAGIACATVFRAPFVLEVRDLWPQSVVEVGALKEGSVPVRILEQIEKALYRVAKHIVVVTDTFVDELVERGVPREKLSVVKNGVDLERFQPRPMDLELRREIGVPRDAFLCLYVGTHGMAHGLDSLLDAAELLKDRPNIRLVLLGEGAEKARLKQRASSMGLGERVRFIDQQPRDRVARFLAASNLAVVPLRKTELFKTVLPSKIFEILGAARPLVLAVDGEARRLVEASGGGAYVPPEDAEALSATISELSADPKRCRAMGKAGRAYVEEHFDREALASRYVEQLERVVASA